MTPNARLQTTIEALAEIDKTPQPADVVLSRFFRARRFVGSKDRAHIAGAVYRILRSSARIGWWLDKVGSPVEARMLAFADQLLNEHLPLAQLHNLCDGDDYSPDRLSSREHAALKEMNEAPLEPENMPEFVKLECPPAVGPMLQEIYGERFHDVMRAMQTQAPMDVRVNTLRTNKEKILREFKGVAFNVSECKFAPDGLRLHGRPNLNVHPAFSTGLVEVQDEGSQLIALVTDARPGMRVMDFCAGAGGKTLALAASMQGKGRIVASDVNDNRLQKAKLRLRRADVQNVELQSIEDEHDPVLRKSKESFDRVLVDAPCTGTGTWRRNPEMRWREKGEGTSLGLDDLLPLQKSILNRASKLVKPGGALVYATCSLLPQENENQVDDFLANNPLFFVKPVPDVWAEAGFSTPCPANGPYLRLDPAQHGTDGFFAAVLIRKEG